MACLWGVRPADQGAASVLAERFEAMTAALTAECLCKALNRFIFISSSSLCFYRTYFESVSLSCEQLKMQRVNKKKNMLLEGSVMKGKEAPPSLTGREQIQK